MKNTSILLLVSLAILTGCLATKTPVVTYDEIGQAHTNIVWSTTPAVSNIVGGVGAVAPLVPPPYGTLLTLIAGLFGTSVASYVAYRNRQETVKAQAVNTSIIEGVESLGEAASAVKAAIKEVSVNNGNAVDVHTAVKDTVG